MDEVEDTINNSTSKEETQRNHNGNRIDPTDGPLETAKSKRLLLRWIHIFAQIQINDIISVFNILLTGGLKRWHCATV